MTRVLLPEFQSAGAEFAQPWHAQLFALTVALNEAGHFAWSEWAEAFGETLRRHGLDKELDGGDDYFLAWVDALEGLLTARGVAAAGDLETLKERWAQAYLRTPHGSPVRLEG